MPDLGSRHAKGLTVLRVPCGAEREGETMDEMNVTRGRNAPPFEREWNRPFEPHIEIRRRSRHIMILGVLLVIGFLAPMLTMKPVYTGGRSGYPGRSSCQMVSMRTEFTFPSIEAAFGRNAHWLQRVVGLTPLLAGAGAILLACFVTSRLRGWGLIGAWSIPVVATIVFIMSAVMSSPMLNKVGGSVAASGANATAGYTMLALSAGVLGIFVGSRARWYRPDSKPAFWIGRVGGALFVLGLLMPVLPKSEGLLPLLLPFRMMAFGGVFVWLGFWLLVSMGLMVTAAVVCFGTGTDIPRYNAHQLSGRAFAFWKSSTLVLAGAVVLAVLWSIKCSLGMLPVVFFGGIQLVCCGVAWWLLLPFGVTDLVVGEPSLSLAPAGGDDASVEAVQATDGPDGGIPAVDPFRNPDVGRVETPAEDPFHVSQPGEQPHLVRTEVPDVDPFHVPQPEETPQATVPASEVKPVDLEPVEEAVTLSDEVRAKLTKLEAFRDAELLTQEEFEKRRDALLAPTAGARS